MRFKLMWRRFVFGININKRKVVYYGLVFVAFCLIVGLVSTFLQVKPLVMELALATATDAVTLTVHQVISEKIAAGNLNYSDLVFLEKDADGKINALVTNMANINSMQAEISNSLVERFLETDITVINVPIGNVIGGTFLSGKGPKISVEILSVTNVLTKFRNEFISAGINQTRHQIMLDVEVELSIFLAGSKATETVVTEVNVAETVIVGNVPDNYATIG